VAGRTQGEGKAAKKANEDGTRVEAANYLDLRGNGERPVCPRFTPRLRRDLEGDTAAILPHSSPCVAAVAVTPNRLPDESNTIPPNGNIPSLPFPKECNTSQSTSRPEEPT